MRLVNRTDTLADGCARNEEFTSAVGTRAEDDGQAASECERDIAQAAQHPAEGCFELVVEATDDGIWDRNLVDGVTYVSPRWREQLGYQPLDPVDAQFEGYLHPEDRPRVASALRVHLETRRPYRIEYRLRTKAGNYRWFDARGQATWDAQDVPLRFAGALRDITAHRESQEELARQKDLYAALQRINRTIVEVKERETLLQEVCRIAVENGHFRLAWIGIVDQHSGRIDPIVGHGGANRMLRGMALSFYGSAAAHAKVTAAAIRTGEHQVDNDFAGEPAPADAKGIAVVPGLRAMACFPLREYERVVGVVCLYGDNAGFFTPRLVALLNEMAMVISFALDNIRGERAHRASERALRASEEQFREFASNVPDVFWIADAQDKRLLYVSPAYERIWGRPANHVDGKDFDWMDAVHPADQARVRVNYERGTVDRVRRRVSRRAAGRLDPLGPRACVPGR